MTLACIKSLKLLKEKFQLLNGQYTYMIMKYPLRFSLFSMQLNKFSSTFLCKRVLIFRETELLPCFSLRFVPILSDHLICMRLICIRSSSAQSFHLQIVKINFLAGLVKWLSHLIAVRIHLEKFFISGKYDFLTQSLILFCQDLQIQRSNCLCLILAFKIASAYVKGGSPLLAMIL